jgi:transposase-like protein
MKTQMVIELLRGKPIEEVSREYEVTVSDLSEWRDAFIRNGEAGFKRRPEKSRISEYERALGRLQMENELLKKKENSLNTDRGNSFRR